MKATMDIVALYNYDPDVFNGLVLPTQVNRETLINNLIMECAELELLYSNYDFMQAAITAWSNKQLHVWTELAKTLEYEYEPLWNKDYHVSSSEDRTFRGTEDVTTNTDDDKSYSESSTGNRNGSGTNTGSGTDLHTVYGFNSNDDAPESKDTTNNTVTSSDTVTSSNTTTSTDNRDIVETIDRDTSDIGNIKNESWERGNIGVMSTQDLIKQQREVVQFNLMDYIIKDFKNRFCLEVY
jgi:hypothetical protein